MSIEQRIDDALADLEGVLAEGVSVDQAVFEVAAEHGLKPEVLRIRGEIHLGCLAEVYATATRTVQNMTRAGQIKRSIYRCCEQIFRGEGAASYFDVIGFVEADVGFKLTADEMLAACGKRNEASRRRTLKDAGTMMPPEPLY